MKKSREFLPMLNSTVAVEFFVAGGEVEFDHANVTQPSARETREKMFWHYADFIYLTADGESLLECPSGRLPAETTDFRVIWYKRFWNEKSHIVTPSGQIQCPLPTPMPSRISSLVSYSVTIE